MQVRANEALMTTKNTSQRRVGILWSLISIAWVAYLGAPALVFAAEDDVVFLKNGGRARGVIIESDPAKSTRIRLQDGSIRTFEAAAVDHIAYGSDGATLATPAKPAAPAKSSPAVVAQPPAPPSAAGAPAQPAHPEAAWGVVLGSLHIESTEPGDVYIDGGEYGATPVVVPNLSVGPHKVVIRFHAGDDDSRIVHVRSGAETAVHFDGTAGLRAYRAHRGFNFGIGFETGVGVVGDAIPAINAVARANVAVSRVFEFHADLRFGAFPVVYWIDDGYYADRREVTQGGAALRIAGQLNLGSIYTVSFGFDAGTASKSGPFLGGHISPLGFRMGAERSFLLAFTFGGRAFEDGAAADFLLGGTYLF
jgi:hypothetical protein